MMSSIVLNPGCKIITKFCLLKKNLKVLTKIIFGKEILFLIEKCGQIDHVIKRNKNKWLTSKNKLQELLEHQILKMLRRIKKKKSKKLKTKK